MWSRVDAQIGQETASVMADMSAGLPVASTVEWRVAMPINTQVTITDRYELQTTYSVVSCDACAGLFHLGLAAAPIQLVEIDAAGNPLAQQVTQPPDPPVVTLDTAPAQPGEVIP